MDERKTIVDYASETYERVRQALLHVATVLGDWMEQVTLIQNIEPDFAALIADGLQLVERDKRKILISGQTIRGERAERSIWVCGPASFVVLKACAIHLRKKPKDAFDLHYVLTNVENGVDGVGDSLRQMLDDNDAVEAMEFLRQAYKTIDSIGPSRTAFFLYGARNAQTQDDYDNLAASAHTYVNRLLEVLR